MDRKGAKDKSQAELEIEALADVFGIATTGFEEFYKKAEQSKKGDYSTAASSGYNSTAASSGDSSKAASSGDSSKAASSGYNSTAASSGYNSTAASSGYYSKAASSGDYSKAASSGDYSKAASSGNSSTAASSGYNSTAASSGNSSTAASSGDSSKAASSGYNSTAASSGYNSTAASSGNSSTAASSGDSSKAASSGYNSTAASSGYNSTAASSGDSSKAASSGDSSKAASSGYNSTAASSGNSSTAASSGEHSACSALGYRAAVKGDLGNLLMASEYVRKDGRFIPIGGKADLVDGKKLKPGRWYIVESGKWVEVDTSDGIFSRVISNKAGVKKVKTDDGKILFVVSDENGNSAHGKTIKEAREDLIYKAVAKFDGVIPKSATGKEWVGVYRAVTGACGAGVRMFVETTGKSLDDTYTSKEIAKLVAGQFGADKFAEKLKEAV
jgi:hypothetical protein